MLVYKIRRSDGLFSMGGSSPDFNKSGKIWKMRGHLTSHLGLAPRRDYVNCKIIEYELVETPVQEIEINEYMDAIHEKRNERERKIKERSDAQDTESRRCQYESLKHEFGDKV